MVIPKWGGGIKLKKLVPSPSRGGLGGGDGFKYPLPLAPSRNGRVISDASLKEREK